jgi:hypothetical protein
MFGVYACAISCGARNGHTFVQIRHSMHISLSTTTTSSITLMAATGQWSTQPQHPEHFSLSIFTNALPPLPWGRIQLCFICTSGRYQKISSAGLRPYPGTALPTAEERRFRTSSISSTQPAHSSYT